MKAFNTYHEKDEEEEDDDDDGVVDADAWVTASLFTYLGISCITSS